MSSSSSHLPEIHGESLDTVFRTMLENGVHPSAVDNLRNQLSLTLNNANDKVRAAVEKASRLEQERDALKEKEQQLEAGQNVLQEILEGRLAAKLETAVSNSVNNAITANHQATSHGYLQSIYKLERDAIEKDALANRMQAQINKLTMNLERTSHQLAQAGEQPRQAKEKSDTQQVLAQEGEQTIAALRQELAAATSGLETQRSLVIEKEKTISALRKEIQAKDSELEDVLPIMSDIAPRRSRRRR
ncbi:hypothetical protein NM208_g2792 [Fusarium decemcellulare]|uniref:Uncharacterized protein n=1 Tax=Fusarium decemcellulare TaxID=57161 RepID=A0ACC1SR73_9HYPO|nr:hypothetical protein NM208_g2792 [Fusarium decemcellulare]